MIKQAPSKARLLTMLLFALSCIGLLLFLWQSFGGALPLQPRGYRVHLKLKDAGQLAQQADVRISGVSIGRVTKLESEPETGMTDAEVELRAPFAPRPVDTKAILRQKSLLGEVYIELTPGSKGAKSIPEGGSLGVAQISEAVRLDQILATFDADTRRAFADWSADQGATFTDSGQALNDAIGELEPFTEQTGRLVAQLEDQQRGVRGLIRGSGQVFGSLAKEPGRLRSTIRSSERAFAATGASREELAGTVRALAPFLRETQATSRRLEQFSGTATPVLDRLLPSARALGPFLRDLPKFAEATRTTLEATPALSRAARSGVPAINSVLDRSVPVLERLRPYLGELAPVLKYAGAYRAELAGTLGNLTAATQSTVPSGGVQRHLLRAVAQLSPESLAAYPERLRTNRSNPYPAPGSYRDLAQGLESYSGCPTAPKPTVSSEVDPDLAAIVRRFYLDFGGDGPRCSVQEPLGPLLTRTPGRFPVLRPLP